MRNFFISALDMIISVIAVIMVLGVLYATYTAATLDADAASGIVIGGFPVPTGMLGAAITFVAGMVFTTIIVGSLYIGTGIYKNTKRTAEAVEAMLGS